jgi:GT2 family glycosyltransferase
VMATYNRGVLLKDLLADLQKQTYPADNFEVIVVDDGSKEPVAPLLKDFKPAFKFTLETQKNAGAATARHRGVELSEGEIVVITDDDMSIPSDFIAQHVKCHDEGATVVLGQIAAAPGLEAMPVFERFHAYQLERFLQGVRSGRIKPRGVHVCTGNLSFRREDYFKVGGFDRTLGRSEDRELGVRLEKSGAKLVFCEAAKVVHGSDHSDLKVWLRRAYNYGVYDRRISEKHPDIEMADPWRFFFLVNPLSRPLLLLSVAAPNAGEKITQLAMEAALKADALGAKKAAVFGTTLSYGLEYFRGMRSDAGSLKQSVTDFRHYLNKKRKEA